MAGTRYGIAAQVFGVAHESPYSMNLSLRSDRKLHLDVAAGAIATFFAESEIVE
jgi:hypothetical protein